MRLAVLSHECDVRGRGAREAVVAPVNSGRKLGGDGAARENPKGSKTCGRRQFLRELLLRAARCELRCCAAYLHGAGKRRCNARCRDRENALQPARADLQADQKARGGGSCGDATA